MAKIESLKPRWLKDPEFRKAYDALENEFAIARELVRARARAGLTQAELARQMKTTQSAIARMESGKSFPSLSTLARFSEATGEKLTVVLEPKKKSDHGTGASPHDDSAWLDSGQSGGPLGQLAYRASTMQKLQVGHSEELANRRADRSAAKPAAIPRGRLHREGGMAVYEILEEYVHGQRADIDQGNPVIVEVRDRDTFERLVVKAKIAPPGADLEGGEQLVLRDLAENVSADDWKIVVLEELDPESVDIKPVSDFRKDAGGGA
jgi:transcriptional regulator with XRE-family HTH domain